MPQIAQIFNSSKMYTFYCLRAYKRVFLLGQMVLGLLFLNSAITIVHGQDLTGKQIMEKVDEKFRGEKSSKAEMKIKIIRPNWTREMSSITWSKGDDYAMILITAPAKEEGTAFLKRGNEIWNWVPNIERTIKLPPSMMMQSWMGTDFTNDDLVRESSIVKDYNHEILKDSTVRGRNCWKLQLTPKPDAAVVWGKLLVWVDKEEFLQMRTEFYDEDGYLINIMKGKNIGELGGKILTQELEMIPVDKEGHRTILIYEDLEFNIDIEDSFFTTQKMKRLRP